MEDHTSRVYHASVVETQTSVILRLEYAWIINTALQVWAAGLGNIALLEGNSHVALRYIAVSLVPSYRFKTTASDQV